MNIIFKKVHIHHFLSFDDAIIDLMNRDYCAIKGVNRNPKDSAKSNGAGKSSLFNAISFAITGETLQGLKSNLSNIYFDDGCYVELIFEVDGHEFIILRSKDDKKLGTNLKITVDNEDKSGKTLTESKAILAQYLPELTSELIGSVFMIGQGMPMRFSANTPSGRKEVLEHLSQSDYMIEDIKERISKRNVELLNQSRVLEDKILKSASQESVYLEQLKRSQDEFNKKFLMMPNFEEELNNLELQKRQIVESLNTVTKDRDALLEKASNNSSQLMSLSKEKETLFNKFSAEHSKVVDSFNNKKTDISSKIYSLTKEIENLKSVKDICPTCGQKIPGAVKPDTTQHEIELKKLKSHLESLNIEIAEDLKEYNEVLDKLNNKYNLKIAKLQEDSKIFKSNTASFNSKIEEFNKNLQEVNNNISVIAKNKEFYDSDKMRIEKDIQSLQENLNKLSEIKKVDEKDSELLKEHLSVISKMQTIVKRDFRGFLLKNIIDFISERSKEYASQIFGCNEIEFALDGNNINISFCDKDYDNLSGGEKTRLDLLIQFAIRDMVQTYRNITCNIIVLDEVLDFLDSESSERVINFLSDRCNDIDSVFMISHHDDIDLPVDSEIVIEKNQLGVSNVIHQ